MQPIFSTLKSCFCSFWILLFLAACGKNETPPPVGERVIASAYGNYLLETELKTMVAPNATPADSAKTVNSYIQKWLRNQILAHTAEKKYGEDPQIKALVEDYRQSLLINTYKTESLQTNTDTAVSIAELQTLYDTLKGQFVSAQTLVKVDFVVISANDNELPKFQQLWKDKKDKIGELTTFCQQHATDFILNSDNWMSFEALTAKLPSNTLFESGLSIGREANPRQNDKFYYVHIKDFQAKGVTLSFEAARPKVTKLAIEKKNRLRWDKMIEENYQNALKNKEIELNN
jgi:hypothetical protein